MYYFLINWTDSMTTTTLSYIGDIINDFSPLLVIIVSVLIGIIVVELIIKALRK